VGRAKGGDLAVLLETAFVAEGYVVLVAIPVVVIVIENGIERE
jgi:hypothetical protein